MVTPYSVSYEWGLPERQKQFDRKFSLSLSFFCYLSSISLSLIQCRSTGGSSVPSALSRFPKPISVSTASDILHFNTVYLPASSPPYPHSRLIDWRFVRAVSPDDSAAAPSAPRLLPLQKETGGGGERYCSGGSGEPGGAGRTARAGPSPCCRSHDFRNGNRLRNSGFLQWLMNLILRAK